MSPRSVRIIYWVATILFALAMISSGVQELMQTESAKNVLIQLGYPVYLNIILGVAKVLGAIAILQWKFKAIKEWAYAGFTIDIVGAAASMLFTGVPILMALPIPALFFAVMFTSYFTGKKVHRL